MFQGWKSFAFMLHEDEYWGLFFKRMNIEESSLYLSLKKKIQTTFFDIYFLKNPLFYLWKCAIYSILFPNIMYYITWAVGTFLYLYALYNDV